MATRIMSQFGFAWDHERGADIQPESADVWESYVAVHGYSSSIVNRGHENQRKIPRLPLFATVVGTIMKNLLFLHNPC